MAERIPPRSPSSLHVHDPITSQSPPTFHPGTYVVQVPKDQIYRIPPPENALIVERHQTIEPKKSKYHCSSPLFFIFLIAFVVIAIALTVGFSISLLNAKNPEFKVQHLVVSNSSHNNPDYHITLKVHNPNGKSGILYMKNGVASLFFKEQKMAVGKFPTFNQEEKNSTKIEILVKGIKTALPNSMKKSMKSKVKVSFSLEIKVPAKMKTSSFKLIITCDFEVDSLAKGTHILSQHCETNG